METIIQAGNWNTGRRGSQAAGRACVSTIKNLLDRSEESGSSGLEALDAQFSVAAIQQSNGGVAENLSGPIQCLNTDGY